MLARLASNRQSKVVKYGGDSMLLDFMGKEALKTALPRGSCSVVWGRTEVPLALPSGCDRTHDKTQITKVWC